ncbi:MAG: aminopeptidase P family protein [Chloroflexi bacterium]|nr:aminopeptidase P family protein [Chloroflexota bacterium]
MNDRLANVRAKLAEQNLDALLITVPDNLYYLSGFGGGEYLDATMVISRDQHWISTDSRYYEEVKQRAPNFTLFEAGYDRVKVLGEFPKQVPVSTVGFEAAHLTVATLKDWSKAARKAGFKLKPTTGLIEELRAVKDEGELAKIKRAVQITDDAFRHLVACVKPGMTEKQVAWIIETYMREHGADKVAFTLLVQSGPNGAFPHGEPTARPIAVGEPLLLDIGCRVDHYNSDMTRTIILGEADDRFKQVYAAVLKAHTTAARRIKAGVKGKRADAFARAVAEKSEFKDHAFQHGLGHGVGLQVHEAPRASKLSKDTYKANMTLTIEPGIYIPGWGGVRIEDLVVIHEDGVDVLTQSPKELKDMVVK